MLNNKELIAMFHVELSRNGKIENALEFLIEKTKGVEQLNILHQEKVKELQRKIVHLEALIQFMHDQKKQQVGKLKQKIMMLETIDGDGETDVIKAIDETFPDLSNPPDSGK